MHLPQTQRRGVIRDGEVACPRKQPLLDIIAEQRCEELRGTSGQRCWAARCPRAPERVQTRDAETCARYAGASADATP